MNVIHVKTKEQLEQAFLVRKEVFVHEQNIPLEIEIDEYEEDCDHFLLIDDNEEAIGAGRLRYVDGKGKVERICILKNRRKKGYGRLLMEAIEDVARKKGITHLILHSQRHAEPFYESIGYNTVSDEYLEAGIPHVTMEKSL